MKKVLILFAFMAIMFQGVGQQLITLTNFADTLSGAGIKYYYLTADSVVKHPWYVTFQFTFDHISGSNDSTQVSFMASVDGATWEDVSPGPAMFLGGKYIAATAGSVNSLNRVTFTTSDDNFLWHPTVPLTYRYFKVKVQRYVATSVTTWKMRAYLKPIN